jgi:hypothetical protein
MQPISYCETHLLFVVQGSQESQTATFQVERIDVNYIESGPLFSVVLYSFLGRDETCHKSGVFESMGRNPLIIRVAISRSPEPLHIPSSFHH